MTADAADVSVADEERKEGISGRRQRALDVRRNLQVKLLDRDDGGGLGR